MPSYLYGDGSRFPLDGGSFLDTVEAVIDACVSLYALDESMAEGRSRAANARATADAEASQLQLLSDWINRAVELMLPKGAPANVCEKAAAEIAESAAASLGRARHSIVARRDREVDEAMARDTEKVLLAVERFFLLHELPDTRWSVRWQATGASPRVETAASAGQLRARLSARISERSMWSAPIPLSKFDEDLALEVPRRDRLVTDPASRISVVLAELSRSRRSLVVEHRCGTRQRIAIRADQPPIITPIDRSGKANGHPLVVDNALNARLMRAWFAIEESLRELIEVRSELKEAFLGETDIRTLDRPADFADAMLDSIAPYVQEMRMRSRAPSELILKREVGDGRREEMFVTQAQLRSKYSHLSFEYQARFAEIGIGVVETGEFETPAPELQELVDSIRGVR